MLKVRFWVPMNVKSPFHACAFVTVNAPALELLIVLAYCAVADFLHIGRLAAYVAAVRGGEGIASAEPAVQPPGALPNESAAVDPGELILSDVPLSAT